MTRPDPAPAPDSGEFFEAARAASPTVGDAIAGVLEFDTRRVRLTVVVDPKPARPASEPLWDLD